MTKPSFLIIGAERSGTTSIFNYLSKHPIIKAPGTKEIQYFDRYFKNGEDWYNSNFPEGMTFEATPTYLIVPKAAKRIQQYNPQMKIIVTLRNPVDMVYSKFYQQKSKGVEQRETFEKALITENQFIGNDYEKMKNESDYEHNYLEYAYLHRAFYYVHLENFYRCFPRNNIFVIQAEKLFQSTQYTMNQLFAFLEIQPIQVEPIIHNKGEDYPPMKDTTRQHLKELFEEPNQKLFNLIRWNFDWR